MAKEFNDRKPLNHYPTLEHGIPVFEFQHWNLYLHPNQCYLGRCYLWAKREDAIDLIESTEDEWNEFRLISKTLQKIFKTLFKPDLYNYASLGNVSRHLHIHIIPRYETQRIFHNITFIDPQWGKNYVPHDDFPLSVEILQTMAQDISQKIKSFLS